MQEIAPLQRDAVAEVDEKLREQGGRRSGVKDISEIWSPADHPYYTGAQRCSWTLPGIKFIQIAFRKTAFTTIKIKVVWFWKKEAAEEPPNHVALY